MSISSDTAGVGWVLEKSTQDTSMMISTDPAFGGAAVIAGGVGQTSTTFNSLLSNVMHYFKVKVSFEADYSAVVSSATDPTAPFSGGIGAAGVTSVPLTWAQVNNAPGTQYLAEAAADEGFITSLTSVTAVTAAEMQSLNPDTTYYFRVRTLGVAGLDSAPHYIGYVVTGVYPPAAAVYSLISSTGLSVFWSRNGNPDWTKFYLEYSSAAGFIPLLLSTTVYSDYYEAAGLNPNTTYFFQAKAIDGGGTGSSFYVFPATVTAAAVPNGPPVLTPGDNSVAASWGSNDNPLDTGYYVRVSTAADLSGFDYGPGDWQTLAVRSVTGLDAGRTYYFQVKARNRNGVQTDYYYLGSVLVNSGPDIAPPVVIDIQGGDDSWRGSASGAYMVHFNDFGSLLSYFQVRAATGQNFTGSVVADWTNTVTNINAEVYDTNWALPSAVFNAIAQGVTTYISVRVADNDGNVAVSSDVFYVLRDTTTPEITGSAASPAGWLDTDPGLFAGLVFSDGLSGLTQLSYSASNQAGTGNANVLGWTTIAAFSSSQTWSDAWGVNFAALEDGASNYISVRAADAAGNTATRKDVLRILKNTVGPAVTITSPAGAYVSTITAFEGTAAEMNEQSPPAYTEISLQDLTDPASWYYDGAAFAAGAETWLRAAGQASWSFDASTVPFSPANQYKVRARSRDINGLETPAPYPAVSFRFSQTAPTVSLSTPVGGSTVSVFGEISGTAADAGGAGLSEVEVYIKRISDSKWWNSEAGGWGETMVASATAASADWTFAPGPLLRGSLVHNQQYFVTVRVKDAASPANYSTFAVPGATFTCVDSLNPQAVTQFTASTGSLSGRIDLTWVFPGDDGAGLAIPFGRFAVQYSTLAGAVFSTASAQVLISTGLVEADSLRHYTVASLAPGVTYYLTLWTSDDAELWSGPSPLAHTIAGQSLYEQIAGTVKTPSGAGVTGVLVEAYDNNGILTSETYTVDDGQGSFTLLNLADGFYRVQATWVDGGFSSSIAKDLIPMGYVDTDFALSSDYELAGVSGTIPLSTVSGVRPSSAGGGEAELWRGGRRVAAAQADAAGRFSIGNLLPGDYTLKVKDAAGGWHSFEIALVGGQTLEVNPLGTLLDKGNVYAYPNPARSYVVFYAPTTVTARVRISVFSTDGTLVKTIEEPARSDNTYRWDFSGGKPASGVYFYTVRMRHAFTGEVETAAKKFAVIR